MRSRPAARVPGGPTGAQQPRPASCSLFVSPYITTRRCNSPAGPGLGPHKTSSSRPASNPAHFNIRQIWTISTPVNRHFPFYFHHTTTVSSRQPFLGPHERSTCYVFWFTPAFQASLQDTRKKIPRIDISPAATRLRKLSRSLVQDCPQELHPIYSGRIFSHKSSTCNITQLSDTNISICPLPFPLAPNSFPRNESNVSNQML